MKAHIQTCECDCVCQKYKYKHMCNFSAYEQWVLYERQL